MDPTAVGDAGELGEHVLEDWRLSEFADWCAPVFGNSAGHMQTDIRAKAARQLVNV